MRLVQTERSGSSMRLGDGFLFLDRGFGAESGGSIEVTECE